MELMDTSLDKFYKFIYERMHERLPENMLGKITVAVSTENACFVAQTPPLMALPLLKFSHLSTFDLIYHSIPFFPLPTEQAGNAPLPLLISKEKYLLGDSNVL